MTREGVFNRGMRVKDVPRPLSIEDRIRRQESPVQSPDVDWIYVDPITPGAPPPGRGVDAMSPPFINSWHNGTGAAPVAFRMDNTARVHISGVPVGGTMPSAVFVLPPEFRPPGPVPFLILDVTATRFYTGIVKVNGEVWLVREVVF